MTPEQRARAITDSVTPAWWKVLPDMVDAFEVAIAAAIRDAMDAEREACADHLRHCADVVGAQGVAITVSGLRHVAATIRGRTP